MRFRGSGLAVWFGLVIALGLYSRWQVQAGRGGRCSLDGNRIMPTYQVDLMAGGQMIESFCCVECAKEWPEVPAGAYWQVRDEVTGEPVDAAKVCFVVSEVVTVPSRGSRTHVFKNWVDALAHTAQDGGQRTMNPLQEGVKRSFRRMRSEGELRNEE